MMFRMVYDDLAKFMAVFVVIATGLMVAFIVMFAAPLHDLVSASDHMFAGYGKGLVSMWRLSLGDFEYSDFDREGDDQGFRIAILLLWFTSLMILAVLLLNMLIAMMSTTYGTCIEITTLQACHAKARVIRDIEHQISKEQLKKLYNDNFTVKHEIQFNQNEVQAKIESATDMTARMARIEDILTKLVDKKQQEGATGHLAVER
jgi:hypothetical protein